MSTTTKQFKFRVNAEAPKTVELSDKSKDAISATVYKNTMEMCKNHQMFSTNGEADYYSRVLAYFYPNILMKRYANFRFREYFPIVRSPAFATEYVFEMFDMTSSAGVKNHRAGDIDIVDTSINEMRSPFVSYTKGIRYDYTEFQAATQTEGGKVKAARLQALHRVFEQQLNDLVLTGDAEYGKTGLMSDPSIPKDTVPKAWSDGTKTSAEKLTDLITAYTKVIEQSKNTFTPNVMMMSLKNFLSIFGEPRSLYSDESILSWVEKKLPTVTEIIADPFLDDAGAGSTGVIIAMERNPDYANVGMAMEMTGIPPLYKGTDYVLPFLARSCGLNVISAPSMFIYEGL